MSNLTNFAENKLVDAFARGQSLGAPATWYVALLTNVADAEAGTVTEVSGGSYARASIAASLAAWAGTQSAGSTVASTGTGGQTSNNAAINFATPTAGWGTVTHFAIYDAVTGGNAWAIAPLSTSQSIATGNTVSFAAGALTITFA